MKKTVAIILSLCLLTAVLCTKDRDAIAEDDPYSIEYAMLTEPTEQELIEDEVYNQLKEHLNNQYIIDVHTYYESKEAIEEGLYNSKESEYFGYLLSEVDQQFEETPYVFCVDDTGKTIVKEFVPYEDVWGKVLTNIAIGSGVILICVTVSALTAGGAAPALHMIVTVARDTAVKYGVRSAIGMSIKGAVDGYIKTGNIEGALQNALVEGSEGYKWGAVAGAIKGTAAETIHLYSLKQKTKLPLNKVAEILTNTNYTDQTVRDIHSSEEFKVYQDAKLVEYEQNGRRFLLPEDMDWDLKDPATGLTNRELIDKGYNPVDNMGKKYQLHHVGQKKNSTLALLTEEQHQSNHKILHPGMESEVRPHGDTSFWKEDKENALQALCQLLNLIL